MRPFYAILAFALMFSFNYLGAPNFDNGRYASKVNSLVIRHELFAHLFFSFWFIFYMIGWSFVLKFTFNKLKPRG